MKLQDERRHQTLQDRFGLNLLTGTTRCDIWQDNVSPCATDTKCCSIRAVPRGVVP